MALLAHPAPQAGFEAPFEMLQACHERVQRSEALGADESNWVTGYAQGAEWASMQRYFNAFGLTADQVLTG